MAINVSGLAKQLHVSRQTIHNRAKAAGIRIDDYVMASDGKSKWLTDEGVLILTRLIRPDGDKSQDAAAAAEEVKEKDEKIRSLEERVRDLEQQLARASDQLAAMTRQVDRLTMALQATSLTAANLSAQAKHRGLFARIRERLRGKPDPDEEKQPSAAIK